MASGDFFIALRNYFKGFIDASELENSDKSISYVEENRSNRGLTKIFIEFSGDDFLKFLGCDENDIWFYNAINYSYEGYMDFVDYDSESVAFFEGQGAWGYIDKSNDKLLENISRFTFNKIINSDSDISDKSKFVKHLDGIFPDEIESIIYDFVNERNRQMNIAAKRNMNEDIKNAIESYGFEIKSDKVVLTVGELTELFLRFNVPHYTIKGLFDVISEKMDSSIGGWEDQIWDYPTEDDFDMESFNRHVSWNLEKIMDTFESDDDSMKKFGEIIKNVTSKFELGVLYFLPKNNRYKFYINGFNQDNFKVKVTLWKDFKKKGFEFSEENFFNLLYQPELFDFEEIYSINEKLNFEN